MILVLMVMVVLVHLKMITPSIFFTIYGLKSKIDAHKDTPAAQIAFQLHFKTFEKLHYWVF